MTGTMMRSMDPSETEIDLRDAGDGEDDGEQQPWKTQLETVLEEEEEEEDLISTQSDTRPLINERDPRQINECLKVICCYDLSLIKFYFLLILGCFCRTMILISHIMVLGSKKHCNDILDTHSW